MANFVMTQGGEMSIQDLINEYFGFGGAAGGGAGTATGTKTGAIGSLAGLGAALIGKIINNSGKVLPELPKGKAPNGATAKPATAATEKLQEFGNVLQQGFQNVKNDFLEAKDAVGTIGQGLKEGFSNLKEKIDKVTDKDIVLQKPVNPPLYEENRDNQGENQPIITTPDIEDATNENTETTIEPTFDMQTMFDFIKQQQQEQWEREDAIRAETQAREDNAWQRAVEDMRQAGVNPNLVNAGPAESGGGITQATGLDYTPFTTEAEKELTLLEQAIEQGFQGDQKEKDRIIELIGNVLKIFSIMSITSKTTITKTP